MSKKLLVLVLLLSMLVVVSGCGGAENPDTAQTPDVSADVADVEKVTLMLDWTPNTNHTGFYWCKMETECRPISSTATWLKIDTVPSISALPEKDT
ncbi:MAG: hypothetical protein RRY35_05110, partial [Clostridiales bacterium]